MAEGDENGEELIRGWSDRVESGKEAVRLQITLQSLHNPSGIG